jgi:8-oxo-dGTP pyrophosphatase MutT (NUDIX family)
MRNDEIQRLDAALRRPLPGFTAQLRMAPHPRPGWYPGEIPEGLREGAGLVVLFPVGDDLHTVLTVRHDDLPQHAGQVSFPGGAREPDEALTDAALREGEEEVGLSPLALRVLGALSPLHIPASGFVLHPVVAHAEQHPSLHPADGEVERILEVPIRELRDPARIRVERRLLEDRHYDVPFFDVDGEKVWGATAMVLAELLWLLGTPPDPWGPDESSAHPL